MIHVTYFVSIASFVLSLSSVLMAFILFRRTGDSTYRHLALVSLGNFLMVLLYAVVVYMTIAGVTLGPTPEIVWLIALYAVKSCVLFLLQRSFYGLMQVRFTMKKRIAHFFISFSILFFFLFAVAVDGEEWRRLELGLGLLKGVQLVVLAYITVRYLKRIVNRNLKSTLIVTVVVFFAFAPLIAIEEGVWGMNILSALFGVNWPVIYYLLCVTSVLTFRFLLLVLIQAHPVAEAPVDRTLFRQRGLTEREIEVAEYLIGRRSYREIGSRLFISIPTVKSHVHHIFQKMEIRTRGELMELLGGMKK
ncbi:MAG: hypothetical protein JXD23_07835 [Spirochaetales bacterium]|nr:hypothetical protein [Spirochaetales bacterium]